MTELREISASSSSLPRPPRVKVPSTAPSTVSQPSPSSQDREEDAQLSVEEDDSAVPVDIDEELVLAQDEDSDDDEHDRRGGPNGNRGAARFSLPSLGKKRGGRYSRVVGGADGQTTPGHGRRAAAAAVAAVQSLNAALSSSSSSAPPPSATSSIRSCLTVSNCCLLLAFSATIFLSGYVGWAIARQLLGQAMRQHTTIVVSLDGFAAEYFYLYANISTNIHAVARSGLSAARLIPPFPSSTFPSHNTLATGLWPVQHGIISNRMYNAATQQWFVVGNSSSTSNSVWWQGEPIWVTAQRWGLSSAALDWPGSDVLIDNMRPTIWAPYNGSVTGEQRVQALMQWLDGKLCTLCLLYFSDVDTAGHKYGPASAGVMSAIVELDALMGQLLYGLNSRGLLDSVNLMILSDHGMTAVNASNGSPLLLFIDDHWNATAGGNYLLVDYGPNCAILPLCDPDCAAAMYYNLSTGMRNVSVYWQDTGLPASLHYQPSPLIQPILIVAELGFLVTDREHPINISLQGAHGYDPQLSSMGAIFMVRGPAIARSGVGEVLPDVDSVDVYGLLCWMLGIAPAWNEGNFTQWIPFLAR